MTTATTEIREQLKDALATVRDEERRLEKALEALTGTKQVVVRNATIQTSGRRKRGRPAGSGKRADEAVAIVAENPGITIAELAKKMGIKPNYLYRVMPQLQKERRVAKQGKGFRAASKAAPKAPAKAKAPAKSKPAAKAKTASKTTSKPKAAAKTDATPEKPKSTAMADAGVKS